MNNPSYHWCRKCRAWATDHHFRTPDGGLLGCGDSMPDMRHHVVSPRCGDVWEYIAPAGEKKSKSFDPDIPRFILIEHVDASDVGVVMYDGKNFYPNVFPGRAAFIRFLRMCRSTTLLSAFEDTPNWSEIITPTGMSRPDIYTVAGEGSKQHLKRIVSGQWA